MTKKLLETYVGKIGTIFAKGLTIEVNIMDVKEAYGNVRYKVTPVAGSGEVWVENVTLKEEKNKK